MAKTLEVYEVPMPDGTVQDLAIVKKGRQQSTFVDPGQPSRLSQSSGKVPGARSTVVGLSPPPGAISTRPGSRSTFPCLFRNTLAIALFGLIGTVVSSTLVGYGFARFRFPLRNFWFTVLVSTIFLPAAVTIIPTYAFFVRIGWVATWLPLIVPHYFSNAYNVFLMRQYIMTIPREMDEAAQMDGAGPIRILWSMIIPQCKSVMLAVALFHLVFAWNDYFGPLLYLSTVPDLQPISVALPRFNNIYGANPPLIQAASLMAMALPVLHLLPGPTRLHPGRRRHRRRKVVSRPCYVQSACPPADLALPQPTTPRTAKVSVQSACPHADWLFGDNDFDVHQANRYHPACRRPPPPRRLQRLRGTGCRRPHSGRSHPHSRSDCHQRVGAR